MSVPVSWSRVVLSRVVSPHNFDGLAMSFLAFSASPHYIITLFWHVINGCGVRLFYYYLTFVRFT